MSETEGTGFWLHVWMGSEKSPDAQTYLYLKHDEGYSETDEESLKSLTEDWAQNDQGGWAREHYRYGFDVVPNPPVEWLSRRWDSLRAEQIELAKEEFFINTELNKLIRQKTDT